MVIVLDFTKFGLVEEGNVHSFVVSLLSRGDDNAVKSGISTDSLHNALSYTISRLEAEDSIL